MAQAFPLLWSPMQIGKLVLRNRFVLTGHGTGMGRDFKPNEQLVAYYAERAKGGVGLIMLGSQQVHPTSPGITNLLCNYDDGIIPGLKLIADAVHAHGGRIFGYLSHMGLASSARPLPLWSASAVYDQKYGEVAHQMSEAEMAELVESFKAAALRNLKAGLDGIEVHCGHGLLLNQFLSPLTNKRDDQFGGSIENRVRFPAWVLREVRAAIGPDIPLGIRCSGDELVDGGLTLDDMRKIVALLIKAGTLDYVDVSAGNDGDIVSNMLHEPPMGFPAAPFKHLARGIKEISSVPVIHGTRIKDATHGEKMLAEGSADFVGMCRALIADPHLPNKIRDGRHDAVVPCVACEQACLGRLHRGKHISCVGNPVTGREREWANPSPPTKPTKVVIVGGGPAGMEAAMVAASRGHKTILFEAQQQLGGQLQLAMRAPNRGEWSDLVDHKARRLAALGVDVRLNRRATATEIAAEAPSSIVLATGSLAARPSISGSYAANVFTVQDILAGKEPGRRVLLIDYINRQPGPTTACYLAQRGHEVTMITEGPHIGHKLETQNLAFIYQQLFKLNIVLMPHLMVRQIGQGTIVARNMYTRTDITLGDWDSFVFATPGVAQSALASDLKGVGSVHVVGDAYTPRDVEAAILEGHDIGHRL